MVKKTEKTSQNPMAALLKKQAPSLLTKGKEVEAKIVSLSKKGIVFDVGGKAHAILGELEIREVSTYLPYLKAGDKILARVISEESKNGFPVVSLRKFFEKGKWEILKEKKEKEEEIEVFCGDYGKGGVFIDFMGIRGVIPKIQLTEPFISSPEKLTGQKVKVKILEVDKEKNRLVVSQKASVLKISQKDLKKKFDAIKENKTYKAKVLGASEFGVFCEVEGVEGLIHISEISWEKISNAASYVTVGETIDVFVVEKNTVDLKLNLSLKRLSNDPWKSIEERYPKDKEVDGEVVRKEKYGYFVKLEPGVEGLIHISKLTGQEEFKMGQKIKAFIERVNEKERRMSLVLPQKEKPVMYR
ncbi:MAG: 30S ribosomal protein S1 [Candidatus Roizmanbacteria bacterium GW2011_GWA2_35_19]|uniref:30S ribosomal protein S1 n=2 Tax=Candidatus Roizmaniibacteriota TaxID=1752723 RepID=A0A0G0BME4_9BACT|nr:MAG: 30S ribosomal protein S1 [Candidatus Roizmanbacteria bacterium GW2011_GWC2_35_12]KKP70654.1 MAG: 30S ribosomal protein S1 [Candidatus Roizmanbacteria bacterium GW2011_GWA2_35_19]